MAKSCMMEGWLALEIARSRNRLLDGAKGSDWRGVLGARRWKREGSGIAILCNFFNVDEVGQGAAIINIMEEEGITTFTILEGITTFAIMDHHFCDFGWHACHSGMMGDMARGSTEGGGCRGVLIDGSRVHAADAARRHDDMACGNISEVGHLSTRLSSL